MFVWLFFVSDSKDRFHKEKRQAGKINACWRLCIANRNVKVNFVFVFLTTKYSFKAVYCFWVHLLSFHEWAQEQLSENANTPLWAIFLSPYVQWYMFCRFL